MDGGAWYLKRKKKIIYKDIKCGKIFPGIHVSFFAHFIKSHATFMLLKATNIYQAIKISIHPSPFAYFLAF